MADSRPLRRSRRNRMLGGVKGGLARHFGFSPNGLRILYVIGSVLSAAFPGALVYVILWLLIPLED
jgi:phage shock protein PspC (stress-responsive transcriptional regulator)